MGTIDGTLLIMMIQWMNECCSAHCSHAHIPSSSCQFDNGDRYEGQLKDNSSSSSDPAMHGYGRLTVCCGLWMWTAACLSNCIGSLMIRVCVCVCVCE